LADMYNVYGNFSQITGRIYTRTYTRIRNIMQQEHNDDCHYTNHQNIRVNRF